jgi:hypothetical protein
MTPISKLTVRPSASLCSQGAMKKIDFWVARFLLLNFFLQKKLSNKMLAGSWDVGRKKQLIVFF